MNPSHLPTLLGLAWLTPLASFALIVLFGPRMGKHGRGAGYLATAAIVVSCLLSLTSLFGVWLPYHPLPERAQHAEGHGETAHADTAHSDTAHGETAHGDTALAAAGPADAEHHDDNRHGGETPPAYSGDWYLIGQFGKLQVSIGYYIDSLTVLMFCMVTLIASCIHVYANGYMHDELHDITDHEVTLANGQHLHRPGRFHRFFQYLSLFCFSMLGIVISGNIAMTFVFWELVGICSYFLIGFYIERKSASNAANKAFIVNRVGDFGMIVGLMCLFGTLGTFNFGEWKDSEGHLRPGLFALVRPAENRHEILVPDGMIKAAARQEAERIVADHLQVGGTMADALSQVEASVPVWRERPDDVSGRDVGRRAYWLLVIAGLGIFCGCVGKSAQFPLHVWLPDAMEGPTPVSALVHSATMVAAGVFLVGRFYPMFLPEVLLTIAVVGCITLFIAATIALTATDIKRVLAYSTVSQLGYMMLALGVGGWVAGMMHLITHAFFKSLLFLCSGSVIHAVHTNDMTKMGGLRHKMPYTAYTMLIGCLAIAGAGIPFVVGFSGYYSKDAIVAQLLAFTDKSANPFYAWLAYIFAAGAAMTAFYMFRLWFMTFAGPPRDHHRYDHAHESPKVMYFPLVLLSVLAVAVAWPCFGLERLIEQGRPAGTLATMAGVLMPDLRYASEHGSHAFHVSATVLATATWVLGILSATVFYGMRVLSADEARRQFAPIYQFLINKWYFDELYDALLVKPVHFIAHRVADIDKKLIDWFIDHLAIWTRKLSQVDDLIDRYLVDGLVNLVARRTYAVGSALRGVQTGLLRRYVMFIVVGTVALFVLISFYLDFIGRA